LSNDLVSSGELSTFFFSILADIWDVMTGSVAHLQDILAGVIDTKIPLGHRFGAKPFYRRITASWLPPPKVLSMLYATAKSRNH
jgi:hypothetical protein